MTKEDLKILNEFIEIDRKTRNNKVESDYDEFCERRCIAIQNMLAEISNLKEIEQDHQNQIGKLEVELSKAEKVIDLMAEEIAKQITLTCPYEDYGCYLDCENRCTNDDNLYAECWKMYFESKVGGKDN